MKKFTDFIVDKRYFILGLFIVFTIICAFLSQKVKINYDIAKYLPDDSETRIGMNIMEDEFSKVETSSLNLMFKDLKTDEKQTIKSELEKIDGVEEVAYDESEDYNKNQYTLYVITVDDKSDSLLASKVYDKVTDKYEDYEIYTSGDISQTNKSVLPFWIVALAVFCALIILLIMCSSFTEPFLFLTSVLMAVVINKGTNIIFSNVSHITNSIAAILQMALSMDYSIMLMNRYDQEKEKEKDKVKAMKEALHKAFQSISSSSVTTIVGLLALVFMSFKIGKDLGFILAKGVLFSLVCIFFVLPSLILLFDKLIEKTKKKNFNIKLTGLGHFSYHFRPISLIVFILVFITCFMLKGNLGIDYTEQESDEISKVFKENNQIAIIYKNEDEKKIAKYLHELETKDKVDEVLGYSNTINEKLTYDKLNDKLNDLGSDVTVDDYLLRIIYYDYYSKNKNPRITFNDFVKFIEEEAYNNPKTDAEIDDDIKKDIIRLKNFISKDEINKKRTSSEIASILEIDKSKIDDLFIYYRSKNNNQKMTLSQFANFMNNDVLTSKKYSKRVDSASRTKLGTLTKFVNKKSIGKKMTPSEMANLFGLDVDSVKELYQYYILKNDIDLKMSISEFSNFVLNDVLTDKNYADAFDNETVQNIYLLNTFSNKKLITKESNSKELQELFGIKEDEIKQILLLKNLNTKNDKKYSLMEFIGGVNLVQSKTNYLDGFDTSSLENLLKSNPLLASDPTKRTVEEMAQLLGIDKVEDMYKLYNLIDYVNGDTASWTMTPQSFVSFILSDDGTLGIKSKIDEVTINKLNLLKVIMGSSLNDKKYSYEELANLIGKDRNTIKEIYTLYVSKQNTTTLTPLEFVNFILRNQKDSLLASNVSSSSIKELNLVQSIMTSTLNNKQYTSDSLSDFLNTNREDTSLLYGLYNVTYVNTEPKISLNDFVKFVLNNVVTNKEYSSNFDNEKITKLTTVNKIMDDSLNGIGYTSDEMYDIILKLSDGVEQNMIKALYTYYGSCKNYDESWQLTFEEFVNYLNNSILDDERFTDFIEDDMRKDIIDAKTTIKDAKEQLIGKNYSRVVLNTKLDSENDETFGFIQNVKDMLSDDLGEFYVIGDSPMAYEISKTFDNEMNLITIITMIAIFMVVMVTFKSIIIPTILVLTIQCAVYLTMGILSIAGENVYFIALLIVQSILMGATIDYAILYTSYYLENRRELGVKDAIIESYNKSIHTILTSSSILIIVTLIIACFASAIAAKICKTISEGTLCSTILILVLLPAVLASVDRFIVKKKRDN